MWYKNLMMEGPIKKRIETRRAKRVKVGVAITYSIHESMKEQINLSEDTVETTSRDISPLGIAISSTYFVPKGALLNICIDSSAFYPERTGGLDNPIRVVGKVVSCIMEEKKKYRLGIEFVELQDEDKASIGRFVETHEKEGR